MLAQAAKLLATLDLDSSKFVAGSKKALGALGTMESRFGKIGGIAARGAQTAARNIAKIGAIAAVGIAGAVKTGLDDLAELEDATTSVDGAIAQMGLTGQVTSRQIADWANEIEGNVQAAFDDKAIVAATSGLIRYGKLAPKNLRPAMEVMTDLAARVGDVDTAGELLAKALADPTKAAGKLSRYGIILTKTQQDQIKAFTEAGDAAGAQAVLLDALAASTTGAAAAAKGPYADAINTLSDVSEDARKALAIGFLPVISKVAKLLSSELAKPETIRNIQEFGKGLASGLDSLIETARNLPWQQIGDSLKLAGAGARAVLKAFASLPPWVQTAVLTGWGLNKLSGGALGSIVGELGKGLVKGVLGMTAGVVNLRAATVTGVPGGGGGAAPVAAAGGASRLATAVKVIGSVAIAAVSIAALAEVSKGIGEGLRATAAGTEQKTAEFVKVSGISEVRKSLDGINEELNTLNPIERLAWETVGAVSGVKASTDKTRATLEARLAQLNGQTAAVIGGQSKILGQIDRSGDQTDQVQRITAQQIAGVVRSGAAQTTTASQAVKAAVAASAMSTGAKLGAANAHLSAIQRKPTSFRATVNVSTAVSVRDIDNRTTVSRRVNSRGFYQAQ